MTRETRKTVNTIVRYVVLIVVGFIMIYPLIWMVGATFKTNNEIFSGIGFIPKNPTLDGYKNALKSYGGDIDIFKSSHLFLFGSPVASSRYTFRCSKRFIAAYCIALMNSYPISSINTTHANAVPRILAYIPCTIFP